MKKNILAFAILATIAAPAMATDNSVYIAVDYGTLSMANTNIGGTAFPNPGSIDLTMGYRISKNIAIEAGYMVIGNSTLTDNFGSVTVAQSIIHASGVYTFQMNDQFDLFGKLGVNSVSAKGTGTGIYSAINTSASTSNLTVGLGAQYNVSDTIGIRLQYEALGKSKAESTATGADLTRLSLGVVASF